MIDYANYAKEQKSEDSSPSTPKVPAPVLFEAGEGDLPLLPPPVQGVRSEEIAKPAKEIIRAYFLKHYRKLSRHFFEAWPITYRTCYWIGLDSDALGTYRRRAIQIL